MKIIIAGATGFIGSHILSECIASPDISSIIILTRRSITDEKDLKPNSKVTEIIHDDFGKYPANVIDRLKGAEACIWAIGGRPVQFPDLDTAKRVGIDYTVAGAQAISEYVATSLHAGNEGQRRFRFVYCSGWGAEEDQSKKLWIEPEARKIKGLVEKRLLDIAKLNPDFEFYSLRPGGVMASSSISYYLAAMISPAVRVDDLAQAFVRVAVKGYSKHFVENEEIVKMIT